MLRYDEKRTLDEISRRGFDPISARTLRRIKKDIAVGDGDILDLINKELDDLVMNTRDGFRTINDRLWKELGKTENVWEMTGIIREIRATRKDEINFFSSNLAIDFMRKMQRT